MKFIKKYLLIIIALFAVFLTGCNETLIEKLNESLDDCYIDKGNNKSFDEVTTDLTFINSKNKEFTYIWESNKPEVVSNTGKVTRDYVTHSVIITVKVKNETAFVSKDFNLKVIKSDEVNPNPTPTPTPTPNPNDNYTYDLEGVKSKFKPSDLNIVYENQEYNHYLDVVSYIYHFKHLPKNYLTKAQARALGWHGGYLWANSSLEGKHIGGDTFHNNERNLPVIGDNIYIELDVDCKKGERGAKRIVYNRQNFDIYYTSDHYRKFTYMIGNGNAA